MDTGSPPPHNPERVEWFNSSIIPKTTNAETDILDDAAQVNTRAEAIEVTAPRVVATELRRSPPVAVKANTAEATIEAAAASG